MVTDWDTGLVVFAAVTDFHLVGIGERIEIKQLFLGMLFAVLGAAVR